MLSWPHFLGANASFSGAIDGLAPARKDLHGFWFDVQPTTGTTLSARARLQVNIAVRRTDTFEELSRVPARGAVLPVLWFEEGLDELGDSIVAAIDGAINDPPKYKNYVLCVLLGLAVATLVISLVACARVFLNVRAGKQSGDEDVRGRYADALAIAANHGKSPIIKRERGDGNGNAGGDGDVSGGVPASASASSDHPHHDVEALGRAVRHMLRAPAELAHAHAHAHASDLGEEARPMLMESASSSAVCSQETSRNSSASHSRNTSTGERENYYVLWRWTYLLERILNLITRAIFTTSIAEFTVVFVFYEYHTIILPNSCL